MRLSAIKVNNKGVSFSRMKLVSAYDGYVKQYMKSCALLWDLGYITDPSCFDISSFVQAIGMGKAVSLFNDELNGTLDFSPLRCDYVLNCIELSDDLKVAIRILKSVLEAGQALKDFDLLCRYVKIPKRTDEFTVKVYIGVATHVYNSGKAPLDSPYLHMLANVGSDRVLERISYSEVILRGLYTKIGLSEDKVEKYKERGKSILLGGKCTFDDDVKYLNLLETGSIRGSTKYGIKLFDLIEEYYKKSHDIGVNCISFEQQNFVDCTDNCIEYMDKVREKVLPLGYEEVYVQGYDVIYSKIADDNNAINSNKMFVGLPVFDHTTGTRLSVVNQLNGLSGEISMCDEGVTYSGFPIEVEGYDKRCWYPLYMTKLGDEPLKPKILWGRSDGFMFRDLDVELKRMKVNNVDEMCNELRDALKDVQHDNRFVGNLVAELIKTLICIECDVTLHGRTSPNQAVFDEDTSDITSEGWQYIFREASAVFNSLMFN